jgi:Ribosomal protein S3, C-terminal domain
VGQKVNPNVLRLSNKTNKWKSRYIEKKSTEFYLYSSKDLEIKKFIRTFFKKNGLNLHTCKLNYLNNNLSVFISYKSNPKSTVLIRNLNKLQKIKLNKNNMLDVRPKIPNKIPEFNKNNMLDVRPKVPNKIPEKTGIRPKNWRFFKKKLPKHEPTSVDLLPLNTRLKMLGELLKPMGLTADDDLTKMTGEDWKPGSFNYMYVEIQKKLFKERDSLDSKASVIPDQSPAEPKVQSKSDNKTQTASKRKVPEKNLSAALKKRPASNEKKTDTNIKSKVKRDTTEPTVWNNKNHLSLKVPVIRSQKTAKPKVQNEFTNNTRTTSKRKVPEKNLSAALKKRPASNEKKTDTNIKSKVKRDTTEPTVWNNKNHLSLKVPVIRSQKTAKPKVQNEFTNNTRTTSKRKVPEKTPGRVLKDHASQWTQGQLSNQKFRKVKLTRFERTSLKVASEYLIIPIQKNVEPKMREKLSDKTHPVSKEKAPKRCLKNIGGRKGGLDSKASVTSNQKTTKPTIQEEYGDHECVASKKKVKLSKQKKTTTEYLKKKRTIRQNYKYYKKKRPKKVQIRVFNQNDYVKKLRSQVPQIPYEKYFKLLKLSRYIARDIPKTVKNVWAYINAKPVIPKNYINKDKIIVKKNTTERQKVLCRKNIGTKAFGGGERVLQKVKRRITDKKKKAVIIRGLKKFYRYKLLNATTRGLLKKRLKKRRIRQVSYYKKFLSLRKSKTIKNLKSNDFLNSFFEGLNNFFDRAIGIKLVLKPVNGNMTKTIRRKNFYTRMKRELYQLKKFKKNKYFKEGLSLILLSLLNRNSSELLANFITATLKNIKKHSFFLKYLKAVISLFIKKKLAVVKGIKIKIRGRLNGASKSKRRLIRVGEYIPVLSIDAPINYSESTAFTSNGTIGVKVWVNQEDSKRRRKI